MKYRGGCHCGKIAFEVDGDFAAAIECNCSICSKRGYLLAFVPREKLSLATPEADHATYTFNTGRIRHHFCPTCGCAPFGIGTGPGGESMAAINVRCLDGIELAALKVTPFDGRSL